MSIEDVDKIVRCGRTLQAAVDALDRTHLLAVADRFDLTTSHDSEELRLAVKRHLVGVGQKQVRGARK